MVLLIREELGERLQPLGTQQRRGFQRAMVERLSRPRVRQAVWTSQCDFE
jgi:hypothetical protein